MSHPPKRSIVSITELATWFPHWHGKNTRIHCSHASPEAVQRGLCVCVFGYPTGIRKRLPGASWLWTIVTYCRVQSYKESGLQQWVGWINYSHTRIWVLLWKSCVSGHCHSSSTTSGVNNTRVVSLALVCNTALDCLPFFVSVNYSVSFLCALVCVPAARFLL